MDINCSLSCKHQEDGKCTLYDLGTAMLYYEISDDEVDCLYYESQKHSSH